MLKYSYISLFVLTLLCFSVTAAPKDNYNLKLQYESKNLSIYLIPGINFDVYKNINISDASVTFNKKWLRKYNNKLRPISSRIKSEDVKAIEDKMSIQFNNFFAKEVEENENRTINKSNIEKTLLIKPAITDLIIRSPVKIIPGSTNKKVRNAGNATLVTEIYDNKSGILLGKIIDKQKTQLHERFKIANRAFNKTEFFPVYKNWAKNLQLVLKIK